LLHKSGLFVVTVAVFELLLDHLLLTLDLTALNLVFDVHLLEQVVDLLLVIVLGQILLGLFSLSTKLDLLIFTTIGIKSFINFLLGEDDLHSFLLILNRIQQGFNLLNFSGKFAGCLHSLVVQGLLLLFTLLLNFAETGLLTILQLLVE